MSVTREITLVRHPLRARRLEVRRVTRITPRMARITLGGPDLDGFSWGSPDDHVKVFFPGEDGSPPVLPAVGPNGFLPPEPGAPAPTPRRDYSIRALRREERELDLDLALHGHGPGGSWAARAQVGQQVGILGPRGSVVKPLTYDWYLFAGDETALPSIAVWLERVPAGVPVFAFVEVADAAEEQDLITTPETKLVWLHREGPDGGLDVLERAVTRLTLPPGEGHCWVAGEAGAVKPIRRHLRRLGFGKDQLEVDGYWKRGVADLDHHTVDDDDRDGPE